MPYGEPNELTDAERKALFGDNGKRRASRALTNASELARLRELSEKATQGEFSFCWATRGDEADGRIYQSSPSHINTTAAVAISPRYQTKIGWERDAAFIVACVNYVRAALRDVPAPKADAEKMKEAAERNKTIIDNATRAVEEYAIDVVKLRQALKNQIEVSTQLMVRLGFTAAEISNYMVGARAALTDPQGREA